MTKICVLKSKIHRAKITDADILSGQGLIIDQSWMQTAAMIDYEKVHVVNINNGERFETYIRSGEAGSGICALCGADARRGEPGDIIIIISYAKMEANKAKNYRPHIIFPTQ